MLFVRFVGSFVLRFAVRQFAAGLPTPPFERPKVSMPLTPFGAPLLPPPSERPKVSAPLTQFGAGLPTPPFERPKVSMPLTPFGAPLLPPPSERPRPSVPLFPPPRAAFGAILPAPERPVPSQLSQRPPPLILPIERRENNIIRQLPLS